MDAEVSARIGAEHGERSPDRLTHRNGYRSRAWDTRVGTMDLPIPKLRDGSYFPSLLEPRRRSERVLLAVIQQAYIEGVSTRRVDDLVKALRCDGISKSQVSRICGKLDGVVDGSVCFRWFPPCRQLPGQAPGRRPVLLPVAGCDESEGQGGGQDSQRIGGCGDCGQPCSLTLGRVHTTQ